MKLKLLIAFFSIIAFIIGLKVYIDRDIERFAETFAYNSIHHNPQSSKFNSYFSELASIAMVAVPYHFSSGGIYEQAQVNANFEAIIDALKKQEGAK